MRTLPETFLVTIDESGTAKKTIILAFHEPLEYMPIERWYKQFEGKTLEKNPIWPGRDIAGVLGSTLSVRAISSGVRKALALHKILIQEK